MRGLGSIWEVFSSGLDRFEEDEDKGVGFFISFSFLKGFVFYSIFKGYGFFSNKFLIKIKVSLKKLKFACLF